jgi:hypothetical protein
MRKPATLVLFALLAAAMFAQTPAGTSNHPTPQASPGGTMPAAGAATGEDAQRNAPSAQGSGGVPVSGPTANSAGASSAQGASPAQGAEGARGAEGAQGAEGMNSAAVAGLITAGTEIRATLDTPLSTKTSKPGDRFTATITEPAHGGNGSVVIPTGTRIEGEVADADEAKAMGAALRGKSKLSLRFRDIVLPAGQTLPLAATLISVNDTNGRNTKKADEEGQVRSSARNKDVAKDMAAGAGIGPAAGLVFGGPLKGLAIGALAGGGYVLATKGKEVNLPAQTGMVIRLDQPVSGSGPAQQR